MLWLKKMLFPGNDTVTPMPDGGEQTFDLLKRWQEGDRGALDTLLERDLEWIRRRVRSLLGQRLRRAGDTDDFVQEAAIIALTKGPRFVLSNRAQFRGLMARLVVNVLRTQNRRLFAHKRSLDREQRPGSDSVLNLDGPPDNATRPDERAAREEEKAWLRMALEMLSADDQDVTRLHWEGLSDVEIGAQLGIEANTARMRRTRAVERLTRAVRKLKNGRVGELLDHDEDV